MNKKGQVYILAAIIITFVIYLLFSETNAVHETIIQDDFQALSKNYELEGAKFVNSLIGQEPATVVDSFSNFSTVFTSYAKTKNPEFSMIYLFSYGNDLYVGNYLDENVTVNNNPPLDGCFEDINTDIVIAGLNLGLGDVKKGDVKKCVKKFTGNPRDVEVKVKDVSYAFELQSNRPEIVIVSREKNGEQRKVYTHGNFVPPREDNAQGPARQNERNNPGMEEQ